MTAARIDICCGVGGTGKTTSSAALALAHARDGERVVVLTIDPARRLADALGLEALGNTPQAVPLGQEARGSLHALMLDRKRTWDALVTQHASPTTARALMANPYYQAVTTRLSGSHEYMAVEKLHELALTGSWDRVIVDTPPAQHVVDFFQAPERIRGLLDRSLMRGLLDGGGGGLRAAATRGTLGVVERIAGDGVMADIREFFRLAGELAPGIRERSAAVAALLRSDRCRYWLVSDADAPERNDLLGFLDELRSQEMAFAGFLVNRVQAVPQGPFPTDADLAAASDHPAWQQAVAALAALPVEARDRALAHRASARDLARAAGGAPVWLVPEVPGGIANLQGLDRLVPFLPPRPPTSL